MDRVRQDLRIAVRSLVRHRSFSLVAILTLALGVGATTAIFSVVNGILLKSLPYDDADRLVAFGQTARTAPSEPVDGSSSHVNFLDWQRQSKTIPQMALYSGGRAVVSDHSESEVVRVGSVTPGFFSVFHATPIVGREFTAEENSPTGPRAVVISYGYWQDRFGGRADVLAQTVEISGMRLPIVGVAPPGFDFPRGARMWVPVRNNDAACGRGCVYLNGIGRLADGVSPAAAQQEMATIAAALEREFPGDNFDVTVMVQTLRDRTVGNVRLALLVLMAAVGMVLLIACANVANLVLVRGAARQNEIAIRAALGSGRRGLLSYLLTENLVLACAGGIGGLLLAFWGISALKRLAPINLPRLEEVRFDGWTFAFALAMVMAATVLFGMGPALQFARTPLSQSLGQRGTVGAMRRRWSRSMLLVAEVGLSVMLLLGAGLLLRSVSAMQNTKIGFDPAGLSVFTISLPAARYPAPQVAAAHERIDEQLGQMPGVTSVARISGLPLGPSENVLSFQRADQPPPPPGQGPVALYRVVDPEYFATMKIPILAGRAFQSTDRADRERTVIVSRRTAEVFWPGENPIGRAIRISNNDPVTVVGIVENVRSQTLTQQAQPEMYVPHAQAGSRAVMYVVKSELPSAQVLAAAREVLRGVDTRLPLIGPSAMSDLVDAQLARPRFYLVLLGLFSVLALVLAAVGLYGVVGYVVTQRTREIGVRMALGAQRREVVALMLWQGLRPAVIGMALGLIVAAGVGRVIEGLLYEVKPHDPITILAVSVTLLFVVLIACAIPARRASTVPPADALRAE
jgi:putative ABC transport system permease protein